jgi:hypothetical protein
MTGRAGNSKVGTNGRGFPGVMEKEGAHGVQEVFLLVFPE